MGGVRDWENADQWIHLEDVVAYIRWMRVMEGTDNINRMPQSEISVDGIEKLRYASGVADRWDREDREGEMDQATSHMDDSSAREVRRQNGLDE